MIKFAIGDRVRVIDGDWSGIGPGKEFAGKTGTVDGQNFGESHVLVRFDEGIYPDGPKEDCRIFHVPVMFLDYLNTPSVPSCPLLNKGDIVKYKPYSGYTQESLATVICAAGRDHHIIFFHNEGMHFLHVYHKQFHGIYGFKAHNSALSLYKPGILKMGCLVRIINNSGDLFPEFNGRQGIYQDVSKLGKRFVKVKIDGEDCIVDVKNIQVI
jgi:hypothetical protein